MARKSSLAVFFLTLCLSRPALADEPAASSATAVPAAATPATATPVAAASPAVISPATPEQVHQAVDRAIVYLQTESGAWQSQRQCAACHHVPLPLWSLAEAERQGYAIDKKFVNDTVEASIGSPEKLISAKLFPGPNDPPDTRPLGSGVRTGTAFMAVGARALTSLEEGQKQSLRYIADEIIKKQRDDGSWEFFLSRPPINESQTSDHAWLIMALQGETAADASESQRLALAKAITWYDAAKLPNDPQDKALKILVSIRVGKARDTLQTTIDELLALQRADGGWGQLAATPSDAYATGQALYVLSLAGYTAERPELKRAIDFLIATQKPDGSWPMASRSTPDGSPGSSKLLTPITCAAGSWATLGLARLVPKGS